MSAPARPARAATSPMATAYTSRSMPARPGSTWVCATAGTSAPSSSTRETRMSCSSPRSATRSGPTTSAGSSAPGMAARPGSGCCSATATAAGSTSFSIRATPIRCSLRCGRCAANRGASPAAGRARGWRSPTVRGASATANRGASPAAGRARGSIDRPTGASPGSSSSTTACPTGRSAASGCRCPARTPTASMPPSRRRRAGCSVPTTVATAGCGSIPITASGSVPGTTRTSSPIRSHSIPYTCSTRAPFAPPTAARISSSCRRRTVIITRCG